MTEHRLRPVYIYWAPGTALLRGIVNLCVLESSHYGTLRPVCTGWLELRDYGILSKACMSR